MVRGVPPTFADEWGEDDAGPFVSIWLDPAGKRRIRFRWVCPGGSVFWGFWLAEKASTEALCAEGSDHIGTRGSTRLASIVDWEHACATGVIPGSAGSDLGFRLVVTAPHATSA